MTLKLQQTYAFCRVGLFILLGMISFLSFAYSQAGNAPGQVPITRETGIPVTDPLVKEKCGGCHISDDRGNMQRISWERATPEGWELALQRMVLLDDVELTAG